MQNININKKFFYKIAKKGKVVCFYYDYTLNNLK